MNTVMRVIIFDVDHGACAFIRTPTAHGLMIDCGRKDRFSPARYIAATEANLLTQHNGFKLTKLVVTHPHDDHIEDIKNVATIIPPAMLLRQQYPWDEVKSDPRGDYTNLDAYRSWQQGYNQPAVQPDLGVELLDAGLHLSPDEAKRLNAASFVNNSSIAVVLRYRGPRFVWQFLFGGDLETDGWRELLKKPTFRSAVRGTTFFVVSHHGHASGYCKDLFDAFGGLPVVNVVSAVGGDPSVDPAYSREDHASGTNLAGTVRRMVSTRADGSIVIEIYDTDQYGIWGMHQADNERG